MQMRMSVTKYPVDHCSGCFFFFFLFFFFFSPECTDVSKKRLQMINRFFFPSSIFEVT